MGAFDKLKNKCIVAIGFIIILLLAIFHFIFYFHIEDLHLMYILDIYESSPLFNFSISNTSCETNSNIVFHVWEGKLKRKIVFDDNTLIGIETKVVDVTNIVKINGYLFCYDHISYKDLLYNDQIIEKEKKCQGDYPKDCGTIDTLKQHLCIKAEEACPLYDIGIGYNTSSDDYYYDKGKVESDIYFNNDKYNKTDKKIIGKLILNDGQPCYRINEKLWRYFDSDEAGATHLKCKLEIFGKLTDERYENKGDITYRELYKYNLGNNYKLMRDDLRGDEKVSLYKREFLGIK